MDGGEKEMASVAEKGLRRIIIKKPSNLSRLQKKKARGANSSFVLAALSLFHSAPLNVTFLTSQQRLSIEARAENKGGFLACYRLPSSHRRSKEREGTLSRKWKTILS